METVKITIETLITQEQLSAILNINGLKTMTTTTTRLAPSGLITPAAETVSEIALKTRAKRTPKVAIKTVAVTSEVDFDDATDETDENDDEEMSDINMTDMRENNKDEADEALSNDFEDEDAPPAGPTYSDASIQIKKYYVKHGVDTTKEILKKMGFASLEQLKDKGKIKDFAKVLTAFRVK